MAQSLIYVTAANREEALAIARELVNSRLAACANVLSGTTSVYHWEGEVCEDEEISMILKTRDDLIEQAVEKIKALHSYDCPCVVALPISTGNQAFLDWIDAETETKDS
ncbi:MAG: divalent-cation tolerance protein CutA [Alphaproteobacteria bacterium]|nr:divalent-cation tolerance protein CutA [Alphaproteobacteria bacterium]